MLSRWLYEELVRQALKEDAPFGDLTTEALVPPDLRGRAIIRAKEALVVCGLPVAETVLREVDPELAVNFLVEEGREVSGGTVLAEIVGRVASILQAERVALNFLQHLSGVATYVRQVVRAVEGLPVRIVDTRKTTPGLRLLEKYAVRIGGGHNHRFGLSEGILIKDNHIRACGGVAEAVRRARERLPHVFRIEVEVRTLTELEEALSAGAEVILLDNMSLEELRAAVELARQRAPGVLLEASGGVTLENVRAVAETGVDLISLGALTHSARAVDIHLKVVEIFP
ncbi:carboxylating nicotinate-nucleotide diphosphorylase [Thermosulfurimonas marina]|uniref:Probable nicotinate-nucleotide pyrophosphorylase [carboxylating] n=1 Tax=Thermosulfurimonas marina TaxID=2047767 RepID=A0A6H1WUJ0_9BACT|nr:carboxylating nicotinate-nucleotide diphosphorylase [Thermosulfurimonas marina]QJA06867.1 carboxylating nicotinate-nucleotide diphosphorylase [Thermosulfurimonas marina]